MQINFSGPNWDWRLWHRSIPSTCQFLSDKSNFRLVIFSNEFGATIGSSKFKMAQKRAMELASFIKRPIIFVFGIDSEYLQPHAEMWRYL